MYKLIRPLLFSFSAERAHHITTGLLKFVSRIPGIPWVLRKMYSLSDPRLAREAFGLTFPNPIGLAAGFDKNAAFLHEMKNFGFGFLEIGTITPRSQPGNPQPRLFRLIPDEAIINRMGFNNEGMHVAAERLRNRPKNLLVGGNIGKNKTTPNEDALDDYLACFDCLHPHVDYFVVNVSSPNTPDLRQLQDRGPLTAIIRALKDRNNELPSQKPILLKIAPDLSNKQLDDILAMAQETNLDGLIATNTTIDRDGLTTPADAVESLGAGGLSGRPLRARATEVIRYLHEHNPSIPIIGVGGIMDPETAIEKLKAGATLIQLYTGFIYAGPAIIKQINKAVLRDLDQA